MAIELNASAKKRNGFHFETLCGKLRCSGRHVGEYLHNNTFLATISFDCGMFITRCALKLITSFCLSCCKSSFYPAHWSAAILMSQRKREYQNQLMEKPTYSSQRIATFCFLWAKFLAREKYRHFAPVLIMNYSWSYLLPTNIVTSQSCNVNLCLRYRW